MATITPVQAYPHEQYNLNGRREHQIAIERERGLEFRNGVAIPPVHAQYLALGIVRERRARAACQSPIGERFRARNISLGGFGHSIEDTSRERRRQKTLRPG